MERLGWRVCIEVWEELAVWRLLGLVNRGDRGIADSVAVWVSGDVSRLTAYLMN
jgi:hypothetical protein